MAGFWDERYAGHGFAYGDAPNDFLVEVADRIPPGGRVLCIAEGEGRNAVWLAAQGHAVTAMDQSPVGLAKARDLAAARGVHLATEVADLAGYAFPPCDAVVSIWAHVPADLRRRVHAAIVAALRPGGVLILEAYTPDQERHGTGGPTGDRLMTLDGLRHELAGLTFELGREIERDVHEGAWHHGRSAVVQVVARKGAA